MNLLADLASLGVRTVQLDEPCLTTPLAPGSVGALRAAYARLAEVGVELELTSYFTPWGQNLDFVLDLPVRAVQVDGVASPHEARRVARRLRPEQALLLGVVDGRNVWRTDLEARLALAEELVAELGAERLKLTSTCSLLHVPVDVHNERGLDERVGPWLSFARQKLGELGTLSRALGAGRSSVKQALDASRAIVEARRRSASTMGPRFVEDALRRECRERPVTGDEVDHVAEHLEGFVVTAQGWVQSSGAACVKPPVLFGDVRRTRSLGRQELVGVETMLRRSFLRDDAPLEPTRAALELALREEAASLQRARVNFVQVDDPP
jgi:5-methyltetrahydropteroyltriglutamate--homocysteine methyltransferase